MRTFWRARSARRRALLLAIAAAVFTLTLLLSLAAGLTQRGAAAQVRQAFIDAGPTHRSLTMTVTDDRLSADDEAAARRNIVDAFRGAPIDVRQTKTRGEQGTTVTWRVAPRIPDVTPADLLALEHGFTVLPDRVNSVLSDVGGVSASGDAAATTASIRKSVRTVSETSIVPLGVIAVAGVIAVGMLARLLIVARIDEDRLLRSRGASGRLLIGRAAVEAGFPTVPAVLVGAIVAQVVLWPMYGAPASVVEIVSPPIAAFIGAVAAMTVVSVPAAFRSLGDDAAGPRRGGGVGAAAAATALFLAFAALSTWRFAAAGNADAVIRDPLAVIAPALDLCALAVLGTVLFGPIARALELSFTRGRRLGVALAARLTAHNGAVLSAPIVLVALAVGVATLAAGTTATSTAFLTDSARAVNGGAAQISFVGDTMLTSDADLLPANLRQHAVAATPDVAPVLRTDGSIGQVNPDVLGVRATELGRLVPVGKTIFDAAAVSGALLQASGASIPGPVLSVGARSVDATIVSAGTWADAPGADAPTVSATLWVVDRAGDVAPLPLPTVPLGGEHTARAELPTGGPWTVAAMDVDIVSGVPASGLTVEVRSLDAGGTPVAAAGRWSVQRQVFATTGATAAPTGMGVRVAAVPPGVVGGTQVRVMPAGSTTVPIAISGTLAAQAGIAVGSTTAVGGSVAGFQSKVVRVIPLVPGTTGEPAMLADLPTLVRGYLAVSPQLPNLREAWTTTLRGSVAFTGGRQATIQLPTTSIEAGFVAVGSASLWLGALGAAVFALVALAATIATLQRRRRDEATTLRTLGVGARYQARIRVAEPAAAVVFALIAGAMVGLIAAALIAPALARTSAPSAPGVLTVVLTFPTVGLLVLPIAIAIVTVLLLVLQYRWTLRDASGGER